MIRMYHAIKTVTSQKASIAGSEILYWAISSPQVIIKIGVQLTNVRLTTQWTACDSYRRRHNVSLHFSNSSVRLRNKLNAKQNILSSGYPTKISVFFNKRLTRLKIMRQGRMHRYFFARVTLPTITRPCC